VNILKINAMSYKEPNTGTSQGCSKGYIEIEHNIEALLLAKAL